MKRGLLFFILPCLPCAAATTSVPVSATASSQPGATTAESTGQFAAGITDRTGLTPNQPILISFSLTPLFGGFQLNRPGTGTLRDTITISAMLGLTTASTSNIFVLDNPPAVFSWPSSMTFPPFSMTVPWDANLAALSITVRQEASINDPGNGFSIIGGGSTMTITTESIPEPASAILAAAAGLLTAGRRKKCRRN